MEVRHTYPKQGMSPFFGIDLGSPPHSSRLQALRLAVVLPPPWLAFPAARRSPHDTSAPPSEQHPAPSSPQPTPPHPPRSNHRPRPAPRAVTAALSRPVTDSQSGALLTRGPWSEAESANKVSASSFFSSAPALTVVLLAQRSWSSSRCMMTHCSWRTLARSTLSSTRKVKPLSLSALDLTFCSDSTS